jgi:hypothetical protein
MLRVSLWVAAAVVAAGVLAGLLGPKLVEWNRPVGPHPVVEQPLPTSDECRPPATYGC